jgi:hypothetical protein
MKVLLRVPLEAAPYGFIDQFLRVGDFEDLI